MKKWTPYISLDCEGKIWNIIPGYEDSILLEIRTEQSTIHYYVINTITGNTSKLVIPGLPWWSQAVFYAPGYQLIQEFDEEQNPDTVPLHLYDDDILLWSMKETRFEGFEADTLLLQKGSGKFVREKLRNYNNRTIFEFPWHYQQSEEYFSEVADFLSDRAILAVRAIDYYECEEAVVMSYYNQEESGLSLSLLGIGNGGETVLDEVLEKNLAGIVDPAFLICKRNVIFVKEKQHFFVYRIAD